MPDVQELFRMTTQKVDPEPGFADRQQDHQRRRRRNRKVGAYAVTAAMLAVIVAVFLTSYGDAPTTPAGQPTESLSTSTSPSGVSQPALLAPRCSYYHPQVVANGSQLVSCPDWQWPNFLPLTLTFTNKTSGVVMGLALYPQQACDAQSCSGAPVWQAEAFAGPATRTYQLPMLHAGRYVLLDPMHPASARVVIEAGALRTRPRGAASR